MSAPLNLSVAGFVGAKAREPKVLRMGA